MANLSDRSVSLPTVHKSLADPTEKLVLSIQEGPRLPLGRGSHAGGLVGGQLLIATGTSWSDDHRVKSFLSDTLLLEKSKWIHGPALPNAFAEGAYAGDGDSLYLAGGLKGPESSVDVVCRLRKVNGLLQVQRIASLPTPLTASAAACSNGQLFLACGIAAGKATNQMWSLDVTSAKSTWVKRASLPGIARAYPALVSVRKNLYLLGGLKDGDGSVHERTLQDAYRYDVESDRWSLVGELPVPGYCWSAAPLDANHLLVAGRADGKIHDEVWIIDLRNLAGRIVGRTVIQATCAPLVEVSPGTFWLIGGEPDSNKNRTNRISEISVR